MTVCLSIVTTTAWAQTDIYIPDEVASESQDVYTKYLQPPQLFEPLPLSNPGALACLQDAQGFMWAGTEANGLIRWDGQRIRSYTKDPNDKSKLQSNYITSLAVGPDGKLWLGTGEAGASVLDLETDEFTHYAPDEQNENAISHPGVHVVFADSKGRIWFGLSDGVLDRFDPDIGGFQHVRAFEELSTEIKALDEDADGFLWVGTSSAGVYRFDPDKGRVIDRYVAEDKNNSLSSSAVLSLLVDKDGIIWVGTEKGLNRFDPKKGTFRRYLHDRRNRSSLADNRVLLLFQDSRGTIWVGTEGGLHEMSADQDAFQRYARDAQDPATTAYFPRRPSCAFEDRGGVLYFSDPTQALYKVTPTRRMFRPYVYASQVTEVTSLTPGEPGVVWAGTYGQGIVRFDFNKKQYTVYPILGDPTDPRSVRLRQWILAIHRDKRGHIWLGGQGLGLIKYEPDADAFTQYQYREDQVEGLTSNDVQFITEGKDGSIWLATWGGGLNRFYPKSGTFQDFMNEPGDNTSLSSDHLYHLLFDKNDPNIMWIGTARGGLVRFNIEREKFTTYSLVPEGSTSTDADTILSIHQEDDGILWLGTDGGGLVRFDPKTQESTYITEADGLPKSSIYGVLPGGDGTLWLATNGGGIAHYDPNAEEGARFDVFTEADGITNNVFNQNGYLRTPDGKLLMSAQNGLHVFDPKEVQPDVYQPPVAFTSFKLFNNEASLDRPIWSKPSIHLGYDEDMVSIEFAALSFAAPENNRYMYKMDGLHDWIETDRGFANYADIKGGDYTFRVKAANHHGVWSDQEAVLKVTVDNPPWLRWWAFTIYGAIVLGVVLFYLRYQARKVEALEQAHRLETVENELELTGAVQTGFLPQSNQIQSVTFNLFGFYRPADRASGDWWWYDEAEDRLSVLMGDVTGHGAGPAMVTAAVATAFRIQSRDIPMADRLTVLNEEVTRVGAGRYHMTMTAVEIDRRTGRFIFHSAGGQPIMRLPANGKPRLLPCPGTPLGTDGFNLGRVEGTLDPGERLLLYTDGIPELALPNGRLLGMRRFSMLCERTRGLPLDRAVQQIVVSADVLRENKPQDDDWTFTLVEWTGHI